MEATLRRTEQQPTAYAKLQSQRVNAHKQVLQRQITCQDTKVVHRFNLLCYLPNQAPARNIRSRAAAGFHLGVAADKLPSKAKPALGSAPGGQNGLLA